MRATRCLLQACSKTTTNVGASAGGRGASRPLISMQLVSAGGSTRCLVSPTFLPGRRQLTSFILNDNLFCKHQQLQLQQRQNYSIDNTATTMSLGSAAASRLSGKTILITGASSGIGKATAYLFAEASGGEVTLILTARRVSVLDSIKTVCVTCAYWYVNCVLISFFNRILRPSTQRLRSTLLVST